MCVLKVINNDKFQTFCLPANFQALEIQVQERPAQKIYSDAVFSCTNKHVYSEALKETQEWYVLRELVLTANNNANIPRVRS